ncbi:MAG: hypothetical protein ABIK73_08630 [candidate division WOR-3 bacterium]
MTPKKAIVSLALNDKVVLARRVDEEIILNALGFTEEQLTEILTPEDIKYHPIFFQRARTTDLVIYNRYTNLSEIRADTFFRIWKGESYWEHRVESPQMLCGIANAVDKALYWQKKAKRINWANKNFPKRAELFRRLPGLLLSELKELSFSPKLENPAECSTCEKEAEE